MKISEYSMPPQADHYGAPHPGAKQSMDAAASASIRVGDAPERSERAAAISDASKKQRGEAVTAGKSGLYSNRARPEHGRVPEKSVVAPSQNVSAKAVAPDADHVSISAAGLKLAADDRSSVGTPLPRRETEARGVSKHSGAASQPMLPADTVPVDAEKTAVIISTASNKAADATAAAQGKLLRADHSGSEGIRVSLSVAVALETGDETRAASSQTVPASVASVPGSKKEDDAAVVLNAVPHPVDAVSVNAVISTATNKAADATAAAQDKLLRADQGESEEIRISLSLAVASETGDETRAASSQTVPASVASAPDSQKEGDAAVVPNAAPHQSGYSESEGMSLELSLNTAFLSNAFSSDAGRAGLVSVYPGPAAGKTVALQQSGNSESEELDVALSLGFKLPSQTAAVGSKKEVSDASGGAGDPKLQLLVSLLEKMTGHKIKLFDHEELMSAQSSAIGNISSQYADAGTNFSMRSSSYSETEQISLREEGVIKTGDGQEIKFSLNLTAQFQYSRSSIVQEREGANKTAPLTINFGGTAAQLSSQRFSFGAYSDETSEQTGMTVSGSGFLVLGQNGDDDAGSDADEVGAAGKGIGKAGKSPGKTRRRHSHHGRIKGKASVPAADRQKLKGGKEAGSRPPRDLSSFGIREVSLTVINSQFDLKTVTAQLLGTAHSAGAPSTKTLPAVSGSGEKQMG